MTTEFHDRWEWTDAPRGGSYLSGSQLEGVACHWPGTTTPAFGVESAEEVARRLRAWRNYHVTGNNWSDIGYNFAVDQSGGIWDLRGLRRVGAHSASAANEDANHEWIGVLFVLGADERPTSAMVDAFRRLRTDVILAEFPHATALTGHGREPGVPGARTSCPGPYVADLLDSGALRGAPAQDDPTGDDNMPTKQEFFQWMEEYQSSPEGRKAHLQSLILAVRGSDPLSRELRDALQRVVGWQLAHHELPKSAVDNEPLDLGVSRLRRASILNTDTLGTIVQLLTANGVQLDEATRAKIDQLIADHEEILAELNDPVEVLPQEGEEA